MHRLPANVRSASGEKFHHRRTASGGWVRLITDGVSFGGGGLR